MTPAFAMTHRRRLSRQSRVARGDRPAIRGVPLGRPAVPRLIGVPCARPSVSSRAARAHGRPDRHLTPRAAEQHAAAGRRASGPGGAAVHRSRSRRHDSPPRRTTCASTSIRRAVASPSPICGWRISRCSRTASARRCRPSSTSSSVLPGRSRCGRNRIPSVPGNRRRPTRGTGSSPSFSTSRTSTSPARTASRSRSSGCSIAFSDLTIWWR